MCILAVLCIYNNFSDSCFSAARPDCGTTFHLDYDRQSCPSQCWDWKFRCYCSTAVLRDYHFY